MHDDDSIISFEQLFNSKSKTTGASLGSVSDYGSDYGGDIIWDVKIPPTGSTLGTVNIQENVYKELTDALEEALHKDKAATLKCAKFSEGDKVILNPKCEPDKMYEDLTFLKGGMADYRMYTIKKIKPLAKGRFHYEVEENGFVYSEAMLLKSPLFHTGDKVTLDPAAVGLGEVPFHLTRDMWQKFGGKTLTIESVFPNSYRVTNRYQDGCLYKIKEDSSYSFSSPMFNLNTITQNENRLQSRKVAVSRGEQREGRPVCCGRSKATVRVGHLSNKARTGEEEE